MLKNYDNTKRISEVALIHASQTCAWTVGEVLSYFTGLSDGNDVIDLLIEEGKISIWAKDNHMSDDAIIEILKDAYDKPARLQLKECLRDVLVQARFCANNAIFRLHLAVEGDFEDEDTPADM